MRGGARDELSESVAEVVADDGDVAGHDPEGVADLALAPGGEPGLGRDGHGAVPGAGSRSRHRHLVGAHVRARVVDGHGGDACHDRTDDDHVVVEPRHDRPAFFMTRRPVLWARANCRCDTPFGTPKPCKRCTLTFWMSVYFVMPSAP